LGVQRLVYASTTELVEAMRLPFTLSGCTVRIGTSIGSAIADAATTDPAALIERADMAIYAVKHGMAVPGHR
jgi:predicted signal transduction protein with EAL and GGDEF domain